MFLTYTKNVGRKPTETEKHKRNENQKRNKNGKKKLKSKCKETNAKSMAKQ